MPAREYIDGAILIAQQRSTGRLNGAAPTAFLSRIRAVLTTLWRICSSAKAVFFRAAARSVR